MLNYTLKVAEVRKETADAVTVCFKQPGLKKIKYKAGQYLTLVFRINGRRYVRPYSFSSAPGVDPYLEITVKRVPGGIVSNHICDRVKADDLVEVIEPMGDFVVNEPITQNDIHFFLWGAGSGVTPLFSIAKYLLHYTTHNVTLIYGNRNFESVIFLDKIRALTARFTQRFSIWHFHTRLLVEATDPTVVHGRIRPQKVLSVMGETGDLLNSLHYICGPIGLKESVKEALASLNVPKENTFTEDFELIKDEKEFSEIVTRTVTIIKEGLPQVVEVAKGKSILEAGLDALIELPYSCQVGNCMLCKGKVKEGKVKYIGIDKSTTDLPGDEYLLCCTYPLSENIVINVEQN